MELLNFIPEKFKSQETSESEKFCLNETIIIILKMLNPIAPHISEYLWNAFYDQNPQEGIESSWPEVNQDLLEISEFELVVQINGKVRGKVIASIDSDQSEIEELACTIENVSNNLKDKEIKK